MKTVLQVLKNHGKKHLISILSAILLLCAGSNANALTIQVENTSQNEITINSIYLGFNDLADPFLFFMSNIDLPFGNVYLTGDIPEISVPASTLVFSSLVGEVNSIYQEFDPGLPLNTAPGSYIDIGSTVGFESARLTFIETAVIPEPTSLLLLGSGLVGLWGLRRK